MSEKLEKIGPYELVRSLGRGGMGEVFLAKDPHFERLVALKKIRDDLMNVRAMHERFLREAKIAGQLTHPSIIPIYTIYDEQGSAYYTMPYIEGETLKEVLISAREQEKKGRAPHPIRDSIPALIRIFLNVCQAIAYAHAKKILHRDLKPDNIIVGKYGEVMILDWGLADYIGRSESLPAPEFSSSELTLPGKIPGTLIYTAPERAHGERSSYLTDIYALGVILYQILTLRLPFHRTTLAEFRKKKVPEEIADPIEAAPYRDIPPQLAAIAKRCLSYKKEDRYQSVHELIGALQNYIEGVPEWLPAADLDLQCKQDWEFQENIFLAKHLAITRSLEMAEWVNLMISKASFSGNIKIETEISLKQEGHGIGMLFCIPEISERSGLSEGYSLWIGSVQEPGMKLFRSGIEVMEIPDAFLKPTVWHTLCIEKLDHHVRFFLDGRLRLDYLSHRPITGTHVGLLFRDSRFQMSKVKISVGSMSAQVNCLAVPDAFLASKFFQKALSEYRRIGYSFRGRAEGRDALFRAGITLLEEALNQQKISKKKQLFVQALEEFGKLRSTPGAPLEYLGKSLVYKAWSEIEDEVRCFELALRKYPKHPLMPIVIEEISFRLHESTAENRRSSYYFALLASRYLPQIFSSPDSQKLLESLKKHLNPLFFMEEDSLEGLSIELSFWLAQPLALVEMIEHTKNPRLLHNILLALWNLGCTHLVRDHLPSLTTADRALFENALSAEKHPKRALHEFFACSHDPSLKKKLLYTLFEKLQDANKVHVLQPYVEELKEHSDLMLKYLLFEKEWEAAESLFSSQPSTLLSQPTAPLFPLYGCFLAAAHGKKAALAHFATVDDLINPPLPALLAAYLLHTIDLKKGWGPCAFYWEKLQLYRQLVLFSRCIRSKKEALWRKASRALYVRTLSYK